MTKAKKSQKSINRRTLKYFTEATVLAVDEDLSGVSVDDLFINIYLKSDDSDITYMIQQFEKILIMSKVNHDKFQCGLHDFYLSMASYIKANGLYKKFFELSYLHYVVFCKKGVGLKILNGYQNLLLQQFPYLTGTSKYVACGVDSKGKLMYVPEVGKNLTQINLELHLIVIKNSTEEFNHPAEMFKLFRKYGYEVRDMHDCEEIIVNDQVTTNCLYLMANFITEDTKEFISKPYRKAMDLVEANPIFEVNNITDKVKEKLVQGSMLLPSIGVNARFANCGEVNELYLREVIENEKIVLLFRVKFSDATYISGYYNTVDKVFYDPFKESSHSEITHVPLEQIVLQNYMNLTITLSSDERNELFWFKEVKDSEAAIDFYSEPTVYYEVKEHSAKGNQTHTRHFDRSKYIAELMKIQPFLRRLPVGASASQEAIKVAKKLGIELPKGMTLVRGFIKKVYFNEK